jgi:O-antigen ligase
LSLARAHDRTLPPRGAPLSLGGLQTLVLWLFVFSGWLVIIEPAPYELLFVLTLVLFIPSGLRVTAVVAPLIVFLLLYNLGGAASLIPVVHDRDATTFVAVSFYLAVTAIFFAFLIAADPLRNMAIVRHAWTVSAVVAAITGIIGYFDIAGMGAAWAPIWRAQGTFKDPNVLSTYLIPPAIFIIQGFLLGQIRWRVLSGAALLVIVAAIFLAFSRGAWANAVAAVMALFFLTFLVSPTIRVRSRVVFIALAGAIALAGLLSFSLTFENVRSMFENRAKLVQSYDTGETGRFGDQANSVPLLLVRPNGFGPLQYRHYFTNDPHNVYLNAFASYGWLGGFAYLLFVLSTFAVAWRAVFTASPWQHHAIAIACPLTFTILQGVQIDTDHWRHFYLMAGLMWGLYAATVLARNEVSAARPSGA